MGPVDERRHQLRQTLAKINSRQASAERKLREFLSSSRGHETVTQFLAVALSRKRLERKAIVRGAQAFLTLFNMHPGNTENEISPVGRAIFPDQQGYGEGGDPGLGPSGYGPGIGLPQTGDPTGTIAALGGMFLGIADRTTTTDFDTLWNIIGGADRLNTTFRNAFLGMPFEPPPETPPTDIYDLGSELERSCFAGVLQAQLDAAIAFQSAGTTAYSTGIESIDPYSACAGAKVVIRGKAFGKSQPSGVQVFFPSSSGDCTPATVLSWTDTAIMVEVPKDVGTGCVGFVTYAGGGGATLAQTIDNFIGEATGCLGPIVGERIRQTYEQILGGAFKPICPPCLNVRSKRGFPPNYFAGGFPVIRSFSADIHGVSTTSGTTVDVQPGDTISLNWRVENATKISIAPTAVNGLLNELPSLSTPLDPQLRTVTIKWNGGTSAVATFSWIGAYKLDAQNACGTASATVLLRMRVRPTLRATPFFWGVADAGRQVEGNLISDDWEIFTSDPQILARLAAFKAAHPEAGKINPQRAQAALNHWNLASFIQSVERMQALGLNAYRFSIEWSRIEPSRGNFDGVAVANYQAMIDAVRARGMEPIVALNHLSLPSWVLTPPRWTDLFGGADANDPNYLGSLRGWDNSDTITAYLEYVEFVIGTIKNVRFWISFNEPMSTSILTGYVASVFPPGFVGYCDGAVNAIRNIVAAHAQAFLAIKAIDPTLQVGITDQWLACKPDRDALATSRFVEYHQDFLIRALVKGHVLLTGWNGINYIDERLLSISEDDWTPMLDFFGLQYYKSVYPDYNPGLDLMVPFVGGAPSLDLNTASFSHGLLNDMGWEMFPQGLRDCLTKLTQIAPGLPILVSENGTAEIVDHNRASYIVSHLEQLQQAQADGANVIGYLHWSCADNWEWIDGYRQEARFGLFSVDQNPASNPNKPHAITDGALALSNIMRNPTIMVGDTASRFGRYATDGQSIDPPTMSPHVTFSGDVNGQPMTLLITGVTRLFGMLFYRDIKRWIRLDQVIWNANTRVLQFSHPSFSAIPLVNERMFACTIDASGQQGNGTVSEIFGNSTLSFALNIARRPLAGMWQTADGRTLCLTCPEGTWSGRMFSGAPKADWKPLDSVIVQSGTLTADDSGTSLTGSLGAGGTLVIQPSNWTLKRLPDGVPF
jgi:beta-glucosidase